MPKLGQSRKSRLRLHGKEWKKSVHGDLKLQFTGVIYVDAKTITSVRFRQGHEERFRGTFNQSQLYV